MACSACGKNGHNRTSCIRKRTRKAGQSKSPAKVAASRINGAKGGRPREHVYFEVMADMGEPPSDGLELIHWCQRILAKALKEQICGRGSMVQNAEILKLCNGIQRLSPKDLLFEAAQLVKSERLKEKPKKRTDRLTAPVGGTKPLR